MEDLRVGRAVARRYRNRRIGEFLKEMELSEGPGTGIPKILRAMQANGSQTPLFESDEAQAELAKPIQLSPLATAALDLLRDRASRESEEIKLPSRVEFQSRSN